MKRGHSLVALAVVLCAASLAVAVPVQWAVESGGNGHYYEAVYVGEPGISWLDAKTAAEAQGGYLATVTSSEENAFVYNTLLLDSRYWRWALPRDSEGPWLGGYQLDVASEPDGGWMWVTGEAEPWVYSNWLLPNEPNNAGGDEKYLHYDGYGIYGAPTWNDFGVQRGQLGYVVEYVPEPLCLSLLALSGLALMRRKRQ